MKSTEALNEFERFLHRAGDVQVPRTPGAGVQRMAAFYKDLRADDVDLESDGDMLLFQWGTYDWGNGPMFEVDVTRQLIRGTGEDDDIWQLHLAYRFPPAESLRALGKGDRWCARPGDIPSFERFMMTHAAVAAVGSRDDGQVRLDYECAG
jgi:hypothetical protein